MATKEALGLNLSGPPRKKPPLGEKEITEKYPFVELKFDQDGHPILNGIPVYDLDPTEAEWVVLTANNTNQGQTTSFPDYVNIYTKHNGVSPLTSQGWRRMKDQVNQKLKKANTAIVKINPEGKHAAYILEDITLAEPTPEDEKPEENKLAKERKELALQEAKKLILKQCAFKILSDIEEGDPVTQKWIRVIFDPFFSQRPTRITLNQVFGDVSDQVLKNELLDSVKNQLGAYWGKSLNDFEEPSKEDEKFIKLCQILNAKGLRHNELVKDIGRNIRAYPPYQDTEAA